MFESLPRYNSCHKYELPKDHLLPPAPRNTEEHLAQISKQLFALCYSVESFVNLPNEELLLGFSPAVWKFFHEVILQLPRQLDLKSIQDALMNLYETIVHTQNTAEFTIDELVNPGANVPDPLTIIADGEPSNKMVPIDTVIDGNPFCARDDFELVQNVISATDFSEYTIEFVPDEVPQPEVAGPSGENEVLVEGPAPSKPARKGKAPAKSSKGKGKAKVVESETSEAEEMVEVAAPTETSKGKGNREKIESEESAEAPAPVRSTRGKAKAKAAGVDTEAKKPATRGREAASETSKIRATLPATRARSARIAAKANPNANPPSAPAAAAPTSANRTPSPSPTPTEEIDPDTGIFTGRVRSTIPPPPSPPAAAETRLQRPRPPPSPPRAPDGAVATADAGPSTSTMPPRIQKRARFAESEEETEARLAKRGTYYGQRHGHGQEGYEGEAEEIPAGHTAQYCSWRRGVYHAAASEIGEELNFFTVLVAK
ncbi:hypothetical protein MVEN_02517100 [Mycena venus]|uniref:Uncharacterized protein n=1 Tax=Mycena venus TaxID=2733690 RepID=A0A8H6WUJ9_9AGAR|nr:hypothetical protein MVEN_02517100 [Mycena venus]